MNSYVREHVDLQLEAFDRHNARDSRRVSATSAVVYDRQEDLEAQEPEHAALGIRLHAINSKLVADRIAEELGLKSFFVVYDVEAVRNWHEAYPDHAPEMWVGFQEGARWEDIEPSLAPFESPLNTFSPGLVVNCPGCLQSRPLKHLFSVGAGSGRERGVALCMDCVTEAVCAGVLERSDNPQGCEFICPDPEAMKDFYVSRVRAEHPDYAGKGLPGLPHMHM